MRLPDAAHEERLQSVQSACCANALAVGVGFEPTEPRGSLVFKTRAFDHSATPPGPADHRVATTHECEAEARTRAREHTARTDRHEPLRNLPGPKRGISQTGLAPRRPGPFHAGQAPVQGRSRFPDRHQPFPPGRNPLSKLLPSDAPRVEISPESHDGPAYRSPSGNCWTGILTASHALHETGPIGLFRSDAASPAVESGPAPQREVILPRRPLPLKRASAPV